MKIEIELNDAEADTVLKHSEMRVIAFKAGLDRLQPVDGIMFKVADAINKARE